MADLSLITLDPIGPGPTTSLAGRPRLRLVPAPPTDGPYDDERADPVLPMISGSLALAFPVPVRVAVPLRLVPPADGIGLIAVPATTRLPDPRQWCARLTQAIAEVLAGARPAQQLADVASLDVLHLLERSAGRLCGPRSGPATQPRVASVHVSQPAPGVAEACAVVDTGPRRRALAIRIEGHDGSRSNPDLTLGSAAGRWRCTALHVG